MSLGALLRRMSPWRSRFGISPFGLRASSRVRPTRKERRLDNRGRSEKRIGPRGPSRSALYVRSQPVRDAGISTRYWQSVVRRAVQCLRHRPLGTDCSLWLGLEVLVHHAALTAYHKDLLARDSRRRLTLPATRSTPAVYRHSFPEVTRVYHLRTRPHRCPHRHRPLRPLGRLSQARSL